MLLLNMSNTLELSGLFVCLGQLIKFFSTSRDRKIAGLWFARGVSTQAGTIYIGFPTGKDGGGRPSHQQKICSFPPPGKIPPVGPLPTNFYPLYIDCHIIIYIIDLCIYK